MNDTARHLLEKARDRAQRLRRLRHAAKLSQAKLAALAGVDAATVSRIELMKTPGDTTTWTALAMALKVDLSSLWGAAIIEADVDQAWADAVRAYLADLGDDTPADIQTDAER